MLQKHPKPITRRYIKQGAKILFVLEAICFAGSYAIWYRLNSSRDFRLFMHDNYNPILETYYKFGEYFDTENKCRNLDLTIWQKEGKINC